MSSCYDAMMTASHRFEREPTRNNYWALRTAFDAAVEFHELMSDKIRECAPPASPDLAEETDR